MVTDFIEDRVARFGAITMDEVLWWAEEHHIELDELVRYMETTFRRYFTVGADDLIRGSEELCELARGHVRILTLSAEAHGAAALVRHAVSRGVLVRTASPSSLCCAAPHAGPALGPAEQCS